MGRYRHHTSCDACGSSDACAVYEDGSTYCFSCKKSTPPKDGTMNKAPAFKAKPPAITFAEALACECYDVPERGISAEIAAELGIRTEFNDEGHAVALLFPMYGTDGKIASFMRKVLRTPGGRQKEDVWNVKGPAGKVQLRPFGSNVAGDGGKMIVVVEGGEDLAAALEMLRGHQLKWRAVATMGTDTWKTNLEYFEGFDKVVICYDQDDPGREAAQDFAEALSPGKGCIAKWQGFKDPNDLLTNQKSKLFVSAIHEAKPYEPPGLLTGEAVWSLMENYVEPEFIPYPPEYVELNAMMRGMREGEISLWTAGTSVGKTSHLRRLKQHALSCPSSKGTLWRIGEAELEESAEKTARGLMQFHFGKKWVTMTQAERRKAFEETYGTKRIITLQRQLRNRKTGARGNPGWLAKFKHLHHAYGCRLFFLDHITIGVRDYGDGASLAAQDEMMESVLEFVETTKSHVVLVSHLRKAPSGGKSWGHGAVPSEDDLKGSGSLGQIAFDIIGAARNKHHTNPVERNVSSLHSLKCRETGETGPADRLLWVPESMRFEEAPPPPPEGDDEDGDDQPF